MTTPATSNGLTAAQLASQAGVTEAEVLAEQSKYPDLNPDAIVGNIVTRKNSVAAGLKPAVPVTAAGTPNPAPAVSGSFAPVAPEDQKPTPTPAPPVTSVTPATKSEPPAPGKPAAPPASSYTVVNGDNLTKIAQRYGTTVAALLAVNPDIKNPNLIFAGSKLNLPSGAATVPFNLPTGYEYLNGGIYNGNRTLQEKDYVDIQVSPDGKSLYGKRRSIASEVNGQAKSEFDITEAAKKAAEGETRNSAQEDALQKSIEDSLGISTSGETAAPDLSVTTSDGLTINLKGDQTALSLYQQLMATPEIKKLQKQMADKQEAIDKLDADEAAFANDILKEVQGEAPQSYIDALVAERSKDIYPKKLALTAELRNLTAQYAAEKENAANILQFTIHDADNRYNRMFQMLQFYAQKDQQKLSNEVAMLNVLKDLPSGREVTINGVKYKGMSDTAGLQIVQFTDPNGNITIVGLDKLTGEKKYTQIIGKTKVTGSGTAADSNVKKLAEANALSDLNIREGISKGYYKETPDAKGGIHIYRWTDYKTALNDWSTSKETGGSQWFRNDDTVTVDGKSYTGAQDSKPDLSQFEIFLSK